MTHEWFQMAHARVWEMLRLPQDWVSGAPPINTGACNRALAFLAALPIGTEAPHIFPTTAGGLEVEWFNAMTNAILSFEFCADGEVNIFAHDGEDDTNGSFVPLSAFGMAEGRS